MHISNVRIQNFRNFKDLDVELEHSAVIMGENKVGKSNFLFALRLVLDASLADTNRQLRPEEDIWSGIERPFAKDTQVLISVDLTGFKGDRNLEGLLSEYLVAKDPLTARFTYLFRPEPTLGRAPKKASEWVFNVFGGDKLENKVGYRIRSRLPVYFFQALRDAENDLANWRKSPLRPLLDRTTDKLDDDELTGLAQDLIQISADISSVNELADLTDRIRRRVEGMVGARHSPNPKLGLAPTEATRVLRMLRVLIDDGARNLSDASLGSLNVIYLALRSLEIEVAAEDADRDHTFVLIEEPEAHLHPHLQRLIFAAFLNPNEKLRHRSTFLLTTHSPHIASVSPLETLAVLRSTTKEGTTASSTAAVEWEPSEADDLQRYLDVNRGEILFANAVLFVEGDSEKYLVPVLAGLLGVDLDEDGITVCSVSGTNFRPYARLLGEDALDIPFAVITDLDKQASGVSLGIRRAMSLLQEPLTEDDDPQVPDNIIEQARSRGIFLNGSTLELELLKSGWHTQIQRTLIELAPSKAAKKRAESLPEALSPEQEDRLLRDIKAIGKGRFAQRLASYIDKNTKVPAYIAEAIEYVRARQ